MRLVPRSLSPISLLRRKALRTGMRGDSSALWRFLALVLVGGSPALRAISRRDGFLGGHRLWKTVFFAFIAGDLMRKLTVKEVDVLSVEKLTSGQSVTITSIPPTSRRARKASRVGR